MIHFHKYQGTGNDFVLIDARAEMPFARTDRSTIARFCDRRFGIGADGLILLTQHAEYDFEMIYYNADGRESSMCGNGGRCIVAFAQRLGLIAGETTFLAIDGAHRARVRTDRWVELQMQSVSDIEFGQGYFFLDTGSPHYVEMVDSVAETDVVKRGRTIRYSDRFAKEGTNVNFVERLRDGIRVATYERGVEDETLSCGTGVTAAAIASSLSAGVSAGMCEVPIITKGGKLQVRFRREADGQIKDIWLCGPAERVFQGEIE